MISTQDEAILVAAITNTEVASEISTRIIEESVDQAAAQAILDIISDSPDERAKIREFLVVALANEPAGLEIAVQLELFVDILGYQAAADAANNAKLAQAQASLSKLSASAREHLIVSLADEPAATRIADAIDASGAALSAVAAA